MEKKAGPPPKKGSPAWMATFSDLMTLLLCFFVLLFAMADLDAEQFMAFINSFNGSTGIIDGGEVLMNDTGMVGGGVENLPDERTVLEELISMVEAQVDAQVQEEMASIKEEIEEFIIENELEHKVSVEQNGDAVVLTFADVMLFDSGSAELKTIGIPVLDTIGGKIKTYIEQGYHVRAEGHTDNVPISTAIFPSNWELSAARAIAVAKYFINYLDFDPHGVSAEGYGEYYPVADNNTDEGRAENRRVEVKVIK
ncbi:MAG: hypothetical protein ATN33_08125 [Epulopiscium sp. Nele67-Bin001]|nr:MAG: hypothetical protein BEN18_01610 [Epulopiscium sp. Nuni2H_MBin001]OON92018.1 MAG: hypothetical protein ATN33_08125 [Epulopiscium sp. Nele67-Bin001]